MFTHQTPLPINYPTIVRACLGYRNYSTWAIIITGSRGIISDGTLYMITDFWNYKDDVTITDLTYWLVAIGH